MGFNKADFIRIRAEYSKKYLIARERADQKREALYTELPDLYVLDRRLQATASEIMMIATSHPANAEQMIADVRARNEQLQAERAALLAAHGYPADYTDVKYECEECGDTGYVDTAMCRCMRRALVLAGYESSGIGSLMRTQSFDTFSLQYYRSQPQLYDRMEKIKRSLEQFAKDFSKDTYRNYLFYGATGLGKTHLSTAIAKDVIDRGFDVLYVTANTMIEDFAAKRFGNGGAEATNDLDRYASTDLLIIDDLGTEVANQFSSSCLYDIINTRMNCHRSTIISTNLTKEDIQKRYWDRIASRIFGDYIPVPFLGNDIRMQKLNER